MQHFNKLLAPIGLALLCTALTPAKSNAQNEVKELLTAQTVGKYVVFDVRDNAGKKEVWYNIDDDDDRHEDLMEDGKLSVLVIGRKKGVTLLCKFLNPLRYDISFEDSSIADPAIKNISTFMEAIAGMSKTLGGDASQDLGLGDAIKNSMIQNYTKLVTTPGNNKKRTYLISPYELSLREDLSQKLDEIYAPGLAEWKYHLVMTMKVDKKSSFIQILQIADLIKTASDAFSGDAETKTPAFTAIVADAVNQLKSADNMADFYTAYEHLKSCNKQLADMNKKAVATLDELEKGINKLTPGEKDDAAYVALLTYSHQILLQYTATLRELHKSRESLTKSLGELATNLSAILPPKNGATANSNMIQIGYTKGETDKIHVSTIKIKYRDIDVKDNVLKTTPDDSKSTSFQVRVRRYAPIVVEVSGGVFYSNVAYEQYNADQNVVTKAKSLKSPTVAAAGLNLIFNSLHVSVVHPLVQIGVGTGKDRPSLLAGAGFKIDGLKSLCVTGGPLWAWQNRPQSLSVGDAVAGEAALKNDMKFELEAKPAMYIGIQYNF